jgi:hypothetical protein
MKPVQVAQALKVIADKIKASKNPDRNLVASDIKKIIFKLAKDDSMAVALSSENGNPYFEAMETLLPEAKELLARVTDGIDEEKEKEILEYLEGHEGLDFEIIKSTLDETVRILQALSMANKMLSNKEIDSPEVEESAPEKPASKPESE